MIGAVHVVLVGHSRAAIRVGELLSFGQLLIKGRIKFFEAHDAVDVIDRNPRQPGAVGADASH